MAKRKMTMDMSGNGEGTAVLDEKTETATVPKASKAPAAKQIKIPRLDLHQMLVTLEGTASLMVHRFDEKTQRQIEDAQGGKASAGREKKVPFLDYCRSMYWITAMPDEPTETDIINAQFGFPVISVKNAMVTACTSLGRAVFKTTARQAFRIYPEEGSGSLMVIQGRPHMRTDPVRLPNGSADIRHRGEFDPWAVTVRMEYNARVLSAEELVGLLEVAGFGVGIGEYRPEKNGDRGTFRVRR